MPAFYPPGATSRRDFAALQKVCGYHRVYDEARDASRYGIFSNTTEHKRQAKGTASATTIPAGIIRLRKFQEVMAIGFKFPFFKKTYFTQEWDKCVIPTLAAAIVGSEWEVHGQAICEANGWKHVTLQAAFSTPRQFGKTFNVARTVASLMEMVPGRREIICSTGRRISMYVISIIEAFLKHRGFGSRIKVSHPTTGSRIIFFHDNGMISEAIGLPDNPRISISLSFVVIPVRSCCRSGVRWKALCKNRFR